MSAPFPGPPAFPFKVTGDVSASALPNIDKQNLEAALAALNPPREYYQQYLSSEKANDDMWHPPQGLHSFLRALFYVKSGDWPGNDPHPLKARTAAELAKMPTYYVMELGKTMPETVAPFMPKAKDIAACEWLTEADLEVYTAEYERTGFQGALQAYRVFSDPELIADLRLFSGKTIDTPSLFIGGKSDWGTYSAPGALEAMRSKAVTRMGEIELIDGAGHWIQQEQPLRLSELLLAFIEKQG